MSDHVLSDHPVPDHALTHNPSQPAAAPTPLPRKRSLWPLFHASAVAGVLVLALVLALGQASTLYAWVSPPYTPNFTAAGTTFLQHFGFSVASAGDINDDGFGDVIVGAENGNHIFVYAGSTAGLSTTIFYSDTGRTGENLGWSVSGGGDVNNDTVDDFVVGAPISSTGFAYLYYGSGVGLPTQAVTLTGEDADDKFGWSVAIVGDVNNDGFADVAIGAPEQGVSNTGRVYIFHGPLATNEAAAAADSILEGESALDGLGVSVAGAGDVNGDGIDDLVSGAWKNKDGGLEAGKAYVFYGSNSGVSQALSTTVIGAANDKLGTSVHGAGDVNGDGFADVIVGADAFNEGEPSPGYFAVYPGGPTGLLTTPLFTRQGENNNDHFGFAVAGGGDLDGDGFSDFAVGANEFDINEAISTTNEGKAYGYVACTGGEISPSQFFSDTGDAENDRYGRSLAIVNDVNGDEVDDLVVGAFTGKNSVPTPVGKIYAYYGVAGGCRPAVELTKTVGLANYPALYTNTAVITVPTDAVLSYHYVVRNSGNMTLTQHSVVDNRLGSVTQTVHTLVPGASFAASMTGTLGVSPTPGISITNVATWTGALPITSPSGVTIPANRVLSTAGVAAARVNISGPTTDQDNDGIPDNTEGSGDADEDGTPDYLDPDPSEIAIGGLSIVAPEQAIRDQQVSFTAMITAGTNISYTWDFGDGQTGTGKSVTHAYPTPGIYVVTVTAINSLGTVETSKQMVIRYGIFMPSLARFYFPSDD